MILKVCRQKSFSNGKEGSTELVTEIYSGDTYKEVSGNATIGGNNVILTSYDQMCDITGNMVHYETLNAYLMNDEGKTIERII